MKHNSIKYEDLSSDIKKEIELFYNMRKVGDSALTIGDAMITWFEEHFDIWMIQRYSMGGRDRRVGERRKHVRIDMEEAPDTKKSNDRRGAFRRKNFRLDIEVPVKIIETLIESSTEDQGAIEFVGTLINISKGGFYFKSPRMIEISSIIRVLIDLSAIDKELVDIEALAMVLRVDRLPDDSYGVGVIFSSIYNDNREKLDIFIFKNLAYYIYSS